jgi:hypothetical protein
MRRPIETLAWRPKRPSNIRRQPMLSLSLWRAILTIPIRIMTWEVLWKAEGKMSAAEAAYRHASHLRTASEFRRKKREWAPPSTSLRASHVENPR